MELCSSNIKKFQGTETPKKAFYISGNETFSSPLEDFLCFRKRKPRNGNSAKRLLIFQEVTCKARKTNKKVFFEEISCLLLRFCNLYISRAYGNSS